MTRYFDHTAQADLDLLPPSVRSHQELALVAPLAEAAVVAMFTSSPPTFLFTAYDAALRGGELIGTGLGVAEWGTGTDITAATSGAAQLRVYLQGYKADAADPNVDPNLKAALKYSIAHVIRWWVTGWGREPGVQSASDVQGKSRAFRDNAEDALPPGWDMWLVPFDIRPRPWGL